ncbi:tol-pal system protein YbgF [Maridesulfovibrio ferrireducens]|uniref:Tol-pal system protein YbgF n=1 Tax=Maridesulfovibrio ferrireducens TaxID=246191 RepID=A0A1G9JT85_9BACT|nr:tol-pal system protein YbgF [Maridesulfovibrio ferrireducens]SDL40840.1 tol-pal system protein YbgF [Maridesulfovibrio ferrireducens]
MKYFHILAIFILSLSISGCFAAKQPEQPAWGASEEWRLKSLEENFLNFKEGLREQKDHIDKNHAETMTAVEKIQERLGELDSSIAELKEAQLQMSAMKAEQALVPVPVAVEEEVVVVGGSESSEEKPWMNVPGENAEHTQTQGVASSSNGADLYQEGVRLVMNDKPLEARAKLTEFLKNNSSGKLAPNALYWIGETYYSEKSFAQSILKFKEVSRRFPKANKVPDAMLKIGLAYDKLGDKENAVFYLRTLVDEYPKSDPAKIGNRRLNEIEG